MQKEKGGISVKDTEKIKKPWGQEVVWAKEEKFAGKLISITIQQRTSLHYHKIKDEVFYLYSGKLKLTIVEDGVAKYYKLRAGDTWHIKPKTTHRLEAETHCVLFEVSTPELEDVVRLEDDYGRV